MKPAGQGYFISILCNIGQTGSCEWMNEWMNEWMHECMNEWMHACMNECMHEMKLCIFYIKCQQKFQGILCLT